MEKKRQSRKRKRSENSEGGGIAAERQTKLGKNVEGAAEGETPKSRVVVPNLEDFLLPKTDDMDEATMEPQTIIEDPVEQTMAIEDKPFSIKKFRDHLRKADCVMGKLHARL